MMRRKRICPRPREPVVAVNRCGYLLYTGLGAAALNGSSLLTKADGNRPLLRCVIVRSQ